MKELNTKLQEARKRRKRRKKEPLGWFVNLDGGDVEAGINTFNNAMNTGFGEDLEQDTTDLIKDIDIEVSEDSYKDFHIIKDDEKWFVKELTEYEELLNYATDVDWELADNTDEQREIFYESISVGIHYYVVVNQETQYKYLLTSYVDDEELISTIIDKDGKELKDLPETLELPDNIWNYDRHGIEDEQENSFDYDEYKYDTINNGDDIVLRNGKELTVVDNKCDIGDDCVLAENLIGYISVIEKSDINFIKRRK